ncbi:hypothetical protein [Microcoleus sp.]
MNNSDVTGFDITPLAPLAPPKGGWGKFRKKEEAQQNNIDGFRN